MRPYIALFAALLAGSAVPADAGLIPSCRAVAEAPEAPHSFGTVANGAFRCDAARESLWVEVCLEVFDESATWHPIACETGGASNATEATASAYGCTWGLYLYRSTARGGASTGETGYAASLPTAFFCTPL